MVFQRKAQLFLRCLKEPLIMKSFYRLSAATGGQSGDGSWSDSHLPLSRAKKLSNISYAHVYSAEWLQGRRDGNISIFTGQITRKYVFGSRKCLNKSWLNPSFNLSESFVVPRGCTAMTLDDFSSAATIF